MVLNCSAGPKILNIVQTDFFLFNIMMVNNVMSLFVIDLTALNGHFVDLYQAFAYWCKHTLELI